MARSYEIPKIYTDLVGSNHIFSGGLFSGNKDLPEKEYLVHDIRWGTAIVVNFNELRDNGKSSYEHPTVEYLLSNRDMKRKRWTRGFAVREIDLAKLREEETNG